MAQKAQLLALIITMVILLSSIIVFVQSTGTTNRPQPIRVACVGDSITEGSGYPSLLQKLLGDGFLVGNFGVSGSTVSLNSRKPYMTQPEFQKAKEFDPDIVVIMLGTNDAHPDLAQYHETFDEDYSMLISSFQGLESKPQIWVVKAPPIQDNSLTLSASHFREKVIPYIEFVADNLDLPTIDVYGAFSGHPDYFMDGVHPSSEGATLIASTVWDALVD